MLPHIPGSTGDAVAARVLLRESLPWTALRVVGHQGECIEEFAMIAFGGFEKSI